MNGITLYFAKRGSDNFLLFVLTNQKNFQHYFLVNVNLVIIFTSHLHQPPLTALLVQDCRPDIREQNILS